MLVEPPPQPTDGEQSVDKTLAIAIGTADRSLRRRSRPASAVGPQTRHGCCQARDGRGPRLASRDCAEDRGDSRKQGKRVIEIDQEVRDVFTAKGETDQSIADS